MVLEPARVEEVEMSIVWQYIPNEEQEQVFCPHCSDWRDTPYFTSIERWEQNDNTVVCLRCTKVLAKAVALVQERIGND